MTAVMCAKPEHAGMPIIECENVKLAGHERWRDVIAGAFVIGIKAFLAVYAAIIIGGVILIVVTIGWALIRAIFRR